MRSLLFSLWMGCVLSGLALSVGAAGEPQRIYRCGNAYTNQPEPHVHCQVLRDASVTVIEGTRIQGAPAPTASVSAPGLKVDSAEQRQRDAQAQTVLLAELQRARQQQTELLREWQNGTPERRADEHRQPEKYQRRVAELRSALQRNEADIAGLQREISRLPVSSAPESKP